MTIHWKRVEQNFTVLLFVFQFYPICNFRIFINFGLGTVRSERVKLENAIKFICKRIRNNISFEFVQVLQVVSEKYLQAMKDVFQRL